MQQRDNLTITLNKSLGQLGLLVMLPPSIYIVKSKQGLMGK